MIISNQAIDVVITSYATALFTNNTMVNGTFPTIDAANV
jgi:hypothetical protein